MSEEKMRKVLRKIADDFLESVKEEVDSCVLLCDEGRLSKLTLLFRMHLSDELVKTIKEKGFSKEFTELCKKVGGLSDG